MVEPMDDLLSTFGRQPKLPFSTFWAGAEEHAQFEYQTTLASRVAPVDVEPDWRHTFLPSQHERHELYKVLTCEEHRSAGNKKARYAYDLDQNPARRPRISCTLLPGDKLGLLMTLVSHGVIVLDGMPLLAVDWMGVHGCVSPPYGDSPFSAAVLDLLQRGVVDHLALKSMDGNGWHLPSMGLLYMELLSGIEVFTKLKVYRSVFSDCEEDPQEIDDNVNWDGVSPMRQSVVIVEDSPPSHVKLKAMMIGMATSWSSDEVDFASDDVASAGYPKHLEEQFIAA